MHIGPVGIAMMSENTRHQLITKAAVNARQIDVEFASHVLGCSASELRHTREKD
jgi:hypothetical protein